MARGDVAGGGVEGPVTNVRERSGQVLLAVGLIAALLVVLVRPVQAEPGDTTRVSVSSDGVEGDGHGNEFDEGPDASSETACPKRWT